MSGFKQVFLKDICHFEKGSTGLAKAIPGEYPLVATGANRRSCDTFQFDTKAVCIPLVSSTGHGHASINNIHYQEGKFALGSILVALIANDQSVLDIQFLHLYLSELKNIILVPLMSGAANVALSVTKIKNIEIPLPDLIRQQEIVAQFKSIEVEEKELINEIRYQQALLNKLRQSILQEAIEGKLTADWRKQNPKTEPASELLARIQEEKDQLIKDKVIKNQKPLAPITDEEIPFELPESWEWCRTNDVCTHIVDCPHSTPRFVNDTYRCIDTTCINLAGEILESKVRSVDKQTFNERNARLIPKAGDIVYSREGIVGQAIIIPPDYPICLGQRVMLFRPQFEIPSIFFRHIVTSKFFLDEMFERHRGIGAKHVNMKDLRESLIPTPPIEEQKIIVTKVEKLFTLCDQLEQQINTNAVHTEQLMQAVLNEAFQQNSNKPDPKESAVHA